MEQQKQAMEEKERQLQSLSRDKENLKGKLAQLQTMVKTFVHDKHSPASSGSDDIAKSTTVTAMDATNGKPLIFVISELTFDFEV